MQFAFVSCQDVTRARSNAYRRMIFEDERAAPTDRLGFVLHLGDFVYEIVWYPEDRPQGMYDRRLRDIVRYPTARRSRDFHVPTTSTTTAPLYRAYLHDPDLQDARARWPFVRDVGQPRVLAGGLAVPAELRRQDAPGADAEGRGQPGVVRVPAGARRQARRASLDRFDAPAVIDAPIERFDDHGLGQEPNNLAAIGSLKAIGRCAGAATST